MGLRSDREMKSTKLRDLLSEKSITYQKFREFHRKLPASRQRYSYYEGSVELTGSSLTIYFRGSDIDQKKKWACPKYTALLFFEFKGVILPYHAENKKTHGIYCHRRQIQLGMYIS